MFLTKPSPLSLRVKSKKTELLLLRKTDVLDISQRYPNIWMKYLKKSFYNILSMKQIAVNKIKYYWENLQKQEKMQKSIIKSKTNLNPFTISHLDNFKNETFTKNKDQLKGKLRVNNYKYPKLMPLKKIKEDKLLFNNKKNSYLSSTNYSNKYSSHLNPKNKIDTNNNIENNNIENNNNCSSLGQKQGFKRSTSKFCLNRDTQVKSEKRNKRKSYIN